MSPTWSRVRLDQLQLDAGLGHGPEGSGLPVGLGVLLPHHRVELVVVLVGEDEAHVVVIDLGVHKESSLEVDSSKPVEAHSQPRVGVHGLNNLGSLVVNDPVRIDLRIPVRVQHHSLVGSEVSGVDFTVVRTVVHKVHDAVTILVILADVSLPVTWRWKLKYRELRDV